MPLSAEQRITAHFRSRFLRAYSRGKLRTDPVYREVLLRLRDVRTPLWDIGCGIGLLELFLRENGWSAPATGIDHDAGKIAQASAAAAHHTDLTFRAGDAREDVPRGVSVTALDVLHYFTDEDQRSILEKIADAVPPDGVAIVRDAIRDDSLRYRLTALQEQFSRAIRWLKAERLHFPTRESVEAPFRSRGFDIEVAPLWGPTPFNNYLFVFRRRISGTTKA